MIYKPKLLVQALDYLDQARDLEDTPVEAFYYYVASMTGPIERKLIQVVPSSGALDAHRREVDTIAWGIELEKATGFKPHPSLVECSDCPLRGECTVKALHPRPSIVEVI